MTVNARVQKYRKKLRTEHCRRLDVWIGVGVLDGARQFATVQKRPMWDVVQEALLAYVAGHTPTVNQKNPRPEQDNDAIPPE